jgi:hypothetical protein
MLSLRYPLYSLNFQFIIENVIKSFYCYCCKAQAPVAHACNTSYSRDRDQENQGLKPAGQRVRDPILKKSIMKKGWWSDSRCRSQNHKKERNKMYLISFELS